MTLALIGLGYALCGAAFVVWCVRVTYDDPDDHWDWKHVIGWLVVWALWPLMVVGIAAREYSNRPRRYDEHTHPDSYEERVLRQKQ